MKLYQGAESIITLDDNIVTKIRPSKSYRVKDIDIKFTKLRTRSEAKILQKLTEAKFPAPKLISVSEKEHKIEMEHISGNMLKEILTKQNAKKWGTQIGKLLAKLHELHIIHNDLTTSNMIVKDNTLYFIDFGLSTISKKTEDRAVDLHLLTQAVESYHCTYAEELFNAVIEAYKTTYEKSTDVLERFTIVQSRGKNKH